MACGLLQLYDLSFISVRVLDEVPELVGLLHDLVADAAHLAVEGKAGLDVLCPHAQVPVHGVVRDQPNSVEELELEPVIRGTQK